MDIELAERIILLGLGGFFGFILGYIVRSLRVMEKEIHQVCEENTRLRKRDEGGFMEVRYVKDLLYLLVLVITLLGVWRSNAALDQAKENVETAFNERCVAGQDTRNVQRHIVDAIYKQFTDILPDPDKPRKPPLTNKEVRLTNSYIDNANHFRASLYRQIKPADVCKDVKGVDDDRVKPGPIGELPWPYPHVSN